MTQRGHVSPFLEVFKTHLTMPWQTYSAVSNSFALSRKLAQKATRPFFRLSYPWFYGPVVTRLRSYLV